MSFCVILVRFIVCVLSCIFIAHAAFVRIKLMMMIIIMQGTMPGARRRESHARHGWTTSRGGLDSPWKIRSE